MKIFSTLGSPNREKRDQLRNGGVGEVSSGFWKNAGAERLCLLSASDPFSPPASSLFRNPGPSTGRPPPQGRSVF